MYDYLLAHTDIIRNGFSAAGITEWLKYYYYLLNQFMAAFSTVATFTYNVLITNFNVCISKSHVQVLAYRAD